MRILFFSHYFPPEGNAPASRTYENCKRWVCDGHDVTVVTCAPNVPNGVVYEGYKNRLRSKEVVDGIKVIRVWTFMAANKGAKRRILNFVSYMVTAVAFSIFGKRPDIVIGTSPQFFCGWAGLIFSKLRRTPFVLEIRDLWPESIQAVGAMQNKSALRFLEWLELRMYAGADHIVTVGEGYRQRLLEKKVPAERLSVVSNGVDRAHFSPREKDQDLVEKYGLQDKFVCSYVGTIGMACALDVVVRAAKALKDEGRHDVLFLLVGDGAVKSELEAESQRLGLSNIVFTGRQDKSMIPAFLSVSDVCLVHLRKTDLFTSVMPSKIFEAAGMARPVIMGVAGDAADLVRTARMGIFMEPENDIDLADAVKKMSGVPALAKSLGQAGHDHITKHFDRDGLAGTYALLLEDLLRGGVESRPRLGYLDDNARPDSNLDRVNSKIK